MNGRPEADGEAAVLVSRHLATGWVMLAIFVGLGLVLETFHGLKLRWYVDLNNQTRRLMWTLSHAHGVLVGLVHIAFAATIFLRPQARSRRSLASALLLVAGILLPGGFFLGGLVIHQGDPGIGVFLTPVGGLALLASIALTANALFRPPAEASSVGPEGRSAR